MKNILANAFSINMISDYKKAHVVFEEISANQIPENVESQIGHADMAGLLTETLERKIPINRGICKLGKEDVLYVAQYIGPRLQEGAIKLPEGAEIKFYRVNLE